MSSHYHEIVIYYYSARCFMYQSWSVSLAKLKFKGSTATRNEWINDKTQSNTNNMNKHLAFPFPFCLLFFSISSIIVLSFSWMSILFVNAIDSCKYMYMLWAQNDYTNISWESKIRMEVCLNLVEKASLGQYWWI